MFAQRHHSTGGPEVLCFEELPDPVPGPGQLRIRVEVTGVNFIDIYQRSGLYPTALPATPGIEVVGTVDVVGDGVIGWSAGDPVATPKAIGGYATLALAPASGCVRPPADLPAEEVAALMVQGLTADYLVHSTFPLRPGQLCVVHAAAGGVGLLLVQLAKFAGARVVATAGSPDKARLAAEAGADRVTGYSAGQLSSAVRELSGGAGAEVVYDSVGAATWDESLACLRPRGLMVSFGNASGPVPPQAPLILAQRGSLFLTRPTLAHYIASADELAERTHRLFAARRRGALRVKIGKRHPLAQAAAAHTALESRSILGKVILTPA